MRRIVTYLLPAALLAAVACGGPTNTASPAPGSTTPPNRYGAPEVENPRDLRPFAADPCVGLVTDAQLEALGLSTSGRRRTTATNDQECSWGPGTIDQMASIVLVANRDVLADTYRARILPIFEPVAVDGLPAVRQQSDRTAGDCRLTVGTAEGQGLILSYDVFGTPSGAIPNDPCGRASRLAEQAVANLPPLAKN